MNKGVYDTQLLLQILGHISLLVFFIVALLVS